jgi:EmrB/QacA subfamily drug resistance transporter
VKMTRPQRLTVIGAALLALFLGALDALVIAAAMPTVAADLGRLQLYSWVYSVYFLARAVSLPITGKLADVYKSRTLFMTSIAIFLLSSVAAGCAWNMTALIVARAVQGLGAGGIFALVYIVLADVSTEDNRGRTLSVASAVWGVSSVLGPTLGGVMVTYFSWRWIFFVNVPLGIASFWGIGAYLMETRPKNEHVVLDWWGAALLTSAILSFLFVFLLGGRKYAWLSPTIIGLSAAAVICALAFVSVERRAQDPILAIHFFKNRGFATGNAAVFLSSFAIFSLFAFAPLFIQGVQEKSPLQVGMVMVSLSLGWSTGSIILGQFIDRMGYKPCAVVGALFLLAGCTMTLSFTAVTSSSFIFASFFTIGVGMGAVALSTLLVVQSWLGSEHLGVATSSNQFARTLGGTVGVGICGSFIATHFSELSTRLRTSGILDSLPQLLSEQGSSRIEALLQPNVQASMPPALLQTIHSAVSRGITAVFWAVVGAALLCLLLCLLIPGGKRSRGPRDQAE